MLQKLPVAFKIDSHTSHLFYFIVLNFLIWIKHVLMSILMCLPCKPNIK